MTKAGAAESRFRRDKGLRWVSRGTAAMVVSAVALTVIITVTTLNGYRAQNANASTQLAADPLPADAGATESVFVASTTTTTEALRRTTTTTETPRRSTTSTTDSPSRAIKAPRRTTTTTRAPRRTTTTTKAPRRTTTTTEAPKLRPAPEKPDSSDSGDSNSGGS